MIPLLSRRRNATVFQSNLKSLVTGEHDTVPFQIWFDWLGSKHEAFLRRRLNFFKRRRSS
jgi:hypothetical protein